jgi:uncharacterized protein (TIGR02452 family)
MSLAGVAKQTLAIVERGEYVAPSAKTVGLREALGRAVAGTRLYRPEELADLAVAPGGFDTTVEVTGETTAQAARRLAPGVVLLNFASAKNPGGGFIGGAKAQEEDLARCSALYACQLGQRAYYDANRATESMLYTDHLIYSPEVPFFRDERLELLEEPFLASVITSPAPNAGEALRRDAGARPAIKATLQRRAHQVLAVAAQHRRLVLGAWGCGVFRNDPVEVAAIFRGLLDGAFRGVFERVVFAVYDRSKEQKTLRAFEQQLRPAAGE